MMSSQSCAICGPKRVSRALCNCCQQYLCRNHLQEHDDLLNAQLDPLVDNINQLSDRLQQFDINSLVQPIRIQLDQWKQSALQSIEQIIRQQDATNEQIELLITRIQNIEKQTNHLQNKSIELDIHPLIIDNINIHFHKENDIDDNNNQLILTPVIQSISSSANNVDCVASNDTSILLHRHPTLCLYDQNLNLINQTHPYSDLSIVDMCWSSTANHFIILTDDDVFVLNETKMILEKWNIPTRKKGHWHNITCSSQNLYLTAYKWGTYIYQYNIHLLSFQFIQRWQTPITCTKDESIDHFSHNNQNEIAMVLQNRINNNKLFQLRNDQTLKCIWSFELNQCQMTIHRNRFCLIHQNQWIIIDSNQSQLLYLSQNGLLKQIIDYKYNQPLRAIQITSNFLLITTNHSINLHQLL